MKDYDAYLFDWDGTLANSHDMLLEIMHGQLRRHSISLNDEQIVKQLFGRYGEGMRELGFSNKEFDDLHFELETLVKAKYSLVDLYLQAREMLEFLKRRGKKLGLVTATSRKVIDVAIGNHELLDTFDVIVTGDEMKAQKPDPSGLLMALERVGVSPNRAIMIGDSPKDLLAGNNAGTETLLFYPPEHESQHPLIELKKCNPTYTIRAWQEFLNRLQ